MKLDHHLENLVGGKALDGTHFRQPGELKKLQQSEKYYQEEITATRNELERLKSNPSTIEKYARERYLMKRDNEDLFLIRKK